VRAHGALGGAVFGGREEGFSLCLQKDLAYACIYAYVRFLVWLKMGELDFEGEDQEGGGYYVMG